MSTQQALPFRAPRPTLPEILAQFHIDGETYSPELDRARLEQQVLDVYCLMIDGTWRTLREIADVLNIPEQSASARLRDFRKARYGRLTVSKRRRGDGRRGLWEYRVPGTEATA